MKSASVTLCVLILLVLLPYAIYIQLSQGIVQRGVELVAVQPA